MHRPYPPAAATRSRPSNLLTSGAALQRPLQLRHGNACSTPATSDGHQGTKRHPHGLIGPAGEQAVRTGLLLSGGLQPVHPDAGPVNKLLNVNLPGAIDSAGFVVPLIKGLPTQPITVPIEVKNIRGWIYPQSAELYQVLDKACLLQQAHPDQRILPVFVCRRAHITLFWMAQQLGFMVIEMGVQFVGDVDETLMHEVRNELHFQDLSSGPGPSLRVRDRFQRTVPVHGVNIATAWHRTATNPRIAPLITELRQAKGRRRYELMTALRAQVIAEGHRGF